MASGCAPIVPHVGGTSEYAVHGENSRVVDAPTEEATFESVAGLMADPERLGRLREGAALSVRRFSVMRAAVSEYATFAEAHADHGREVSPVAEHRRAAFASGGPA